MSNSTAVYDLPPLPDYTLKPLPSLVPRFADEYLTLLLPVLAYWAVSGIFHLIDTYDLFPQYRLHTPIELLKRNHATRWEVFRDVILQQIIQTLFGLVLAVLEPQAMYGKADYDVAVWAQRVRLTQRGIPAVLSLVGLDAAGISQKLMSSKPTLAGVLSGGNYPWLMQATSIGGHRMIVPAFASWELLLAKSIYWYIVPGLQFLLGILIVDTWQYWLHRTMHNNKWLYATFHSRHHRLYVPYAYGALYNHPFEGFLLDTLGTGLAYLAAGMTCRQSMWFFTCSTIKTVDDHCGYALPFDPLQLVTSNNAAYHDIHHQSWGIKSNFSQPFFTFWDRILGTVWKGGDVTLRYERSRLQAEKKMREALPDSASTTETEEAQGDQDKLVAIRHKHKKRASSSAQAGGNLKNLQKRVNESLVGKGGNVIGVESGH